MAVLYVPIRPTAAARRNLNGGGRLRVGWLNGVPREQTMLKRHLPRVIYHQVYLYTTTDLERIGELVLWFVLRFLRSLVSASGFRVQGLGLGGWGGSFVVWVQGLGFGG